MSEISAELRKIREETVQRHIDTELGGDLEGAIGTFAPGRVSYDIPASDQFLDSEAEVRVYITEFLERTHTRSMDVLKLHHTEDAVVAEVRLNAFFLDERNGDPTKGTPKSCRSCVIFRFDGEEMWQEAAYGNDIFH